MYSNPGPHFLESVVTPEDRSKRERSCSADAPSIDGKKQRTPLDMEVKRGSESTMVGAYLSPAIIFPLGEPTRVIAQRKPMVAELWSSSKKRRVPGMIQ